MQVKFNDTYSGTYKLPGGGHQGTISGLIEFFVQSNDNADCVDEDLRFKFVVDLNVLESVMRIVASPASMLEEPTRENEEQFAFHPALSSLLNLLRLPEDYQFTN